MGTFGVNVAEGRSNTHVFYSEDHREINAAASWQCIVDGGGRGSSGCRDILSIDSRLNRIDPSKNIFPPNPERGYRTS